MVRMRPRKVALFVATVGVTVIIIAVLFRFRCLSGIIDRNHMQTDNMYYQEYKVHARNTDTKASVAAEVRHKPALGDEIHDLPQREYEDPILKIEKETVSNAWKNKPQYRREHIRKVVEMNKRRDYTLTSSEKKKSDVIAGGNQQILHRTWKEPQWEIAEILRRVPTLTEPAVPVFVVEEHFEVLKYWFDAVSTGVLPGRGNTLFHIDGHSDAAPPSDTSIIPRFRLPANHSEVANMMQKNDVFIAGAALTGLITRFIWVWPEWDKADHENETNHGVFDVQVGYYRSGVSVPQVCMCMRYVPEADSECIADARSRDDNQKTVDLDPRDCDIVSSGVFEVVHEREAARLLQQGGWIEEDEKLILDIDEDYFGCESSGIIPLLDAGVTQLQVDTVSWWVGQVLCVNDVVGEGIADAAFHTLVDTLLNYKSSLCSRKPAKSQKDCESKFNVEENAVTAFLKIAEDVLRQGPAKDLLCKAETVVSEHWTELRNLLRSLLVLTPTQLQLLKQTGVCLITAPTNFGFVTNGLHVCHGFNVPGESVVIAHTPTQTESEIRAALLTRTLSLLPAPPSLVTVCRSVRDGYTPWSDFEFAERAVLGGLKTAFKGVKEDYFHFDENLLGGKNGWPSRHND